MDSVATPSPPSSPTLQADFFDAYADDYIDFTYENPTAYHVVEYSAAMLEKAGFQYLSEKKDWSQSITPGNYYTTRSGTSLVAFSVGKDWTPSKGAGIIGGHIDALTVKLKPVSTKPKAEGYELLAVAPYAGALSDVWWDRDLGIGGRILVCEKDKIVSKLVNSCPHPIAKIPTLAPHFGDPANGPFNKETQAVPVLGFDFEEEPTEEEKTAPLFNRHPLCLLRYVANLAKVKVADIVEMDLDLFDVQKGVRAGIKGDFISAPRIDDRICSFAALHSLLESVDELDSSDHFSLVALYDNEEIGSLTRQGAKGGIMESVVERVTSSLFDLSQTKTVFANSIILSSDVTHLLNPNFSSVYLDNHKPVPNKGIAIALDPNGHMATDAVGLALVELIAKKNLDKLQYFHIRNDSRSGGTIGPSLSTQSGARTIDLGIAQLSMHSIRATVGYKDVGLGIKFFKGFFQLWREIYNNLGDL